MPRCLTCATGTNQVASVRRAERKIKPHRGKSLDAHIGNRIGERRAMLGLTAYQLADMIGVTYQQLLKYERGINRISAGRLYEIARALDVPLTFCFEGLDGPPAPSAAAQRRVLELARNFNEIQNEQHQEALSAVVRLLAAR
jgi:transcriptional regulator with XRE-family HTH domain